MKINKDILYAFLVVLLISAFAFAVGYIIKENSENEIAELRKIQDAQKEYKYLSELREQTANKKRDSFKSVLEQQNIGIGILNDNFKNMNNSILNNEQDKALSVSKSLLTAKDEAMGTVLEISKQDKIAAEERQNQLNIDLSYLKNQMEILRKEAEIKQRQRFWNGVKIGGVSVVVIGAAGLIWLKNR